MNVAEILRRMKRERREWMGSEIQGPQVQWTIRGIDHCIAHVNAIRKEQTQNQRLFKLRVPATMAKTLLNAMKLAHDAVRMGCRQRALDIMQRAIKKAEDLYP